jgi:hypothetical protein
VKIRAVTGMHVAERAGPNAAAAQEESPRFPGTAESDGPNVSGRSFCPEFGATRGGAAASGGGRETEGQPPAVPRQSPRQGTMPWQPIFVQFVKILVLWNLHVFTKDCHCGSYIEQT